MTSGFGLESVIQWGPLVLGVLVAAVGTFLSGARAPDAFITLLQQAIVFFAALVLLISVFYPPLFIIVEHNSIYLGVVAMMTLIYSARDIVAFLRHSKSPPRKI